MVACPFCRSMVTRSSRVVQRAAFQEAYRRAQVAATVPDPRSSVVLAGRRFELAAKLGSGAQCDVWRATSAGLVREHVTLKLAKSAATDLAPEARVLRELQGLPSQSAAYFSQRIPQPVAHGRVGASSDGPQALALRHPVGFWGSLADVMACHPEGLRDSRHVVWLWRRVLEVLAYLHAEGWTHGDLRAEHWLVHPGDHGVMLIGWGRARQGGDPARDLVQSAWAMRAALGGWTDKLPALPPRVPPPLAALIRSASEDPAWIASQSAGSLDGCLQRVAVEAFGPPRFIDFNPLDA